MATHEKENGPPMSSREEAGEEASSLRTKTEVKTHEKEEIEVEQGVHLGWKELFEDLQVREYYPVKEFAELLGRLGREQAVGSLDFSGIELLPDAVFIALRALCTENPRLAGGLTAVHCTGCVHLTDLSLQMIAASLTNLTELSLDGCRLITSAGVRHLRALSSTLRLVSLTGAAICEPPDWPTDTTFKLDGCPLDSTAPLVSSENHFKMVIISGESEKDHLLQFLSEGGDKNEDGKCDSLQYIQGAAFPGVDYCVFNIFQCHCKLAMLSAFISRKAVYWIVVDLEKDTDNPQLEMMSHINAVRGQVAQSTFLVVIIHRDTGVDARRAQAEELGRELERYTQKQAEALQTHVQLAKYDSVKARHSDFSTQQRFSRSHQAATLKNTFHLYSLNVDTHQITPHWSNEIDVAKIKALEQQFLGNWQRNDVEPAMRSLQSGSKAGISELRSFSTPPPILLEVFMAMYILLGITLKKGETVWAARNRLFHFRFTQQLMNYDPSHITSKMMSQLAPILDNPKLTIQKVSAVSQLAAAFYLWVRAMYQYGLHMMSKGEQPSSSSHANQNLTLQGPGVLLEQLGKSVCELQRLYAAGRPGRLVLRVGTALAVLRPARVCLLADVRRAVHTATDAATDAGKADVGKADVGDGALRAAVTRLHEQGRLLFYPDVAGEPIVTDVAWFMRLLSVLPARQVARPELRNGGRFKALPPSIPILDRDAIRSLWQDEASDAQADVCISMVSAWCRQADVCVRVLEHLGVLLPAPSRPPSGRVPRPPSSPHLVLYSHLNERFHIRAAANSNEERSSYFARHFWRDFNADRQTDAHVQQNYSLTVGCPAALLPRVFADCSQVAPVMLMSMWALILRHGAAEVYIRHNVHSAMLSSSVDVSARVTTFGREDGDAVVQAYLWSVIAPYLLLIEHHISQYPGLHVDIKVPCQGSCGQKGVPGTFSLLELPRQLDLQVECSGCGSEQMTPRQSQYLVGRVGSLNSHDYRPVHSHLAGENSIAPYSSTSSERLDVTLATHWVCNHCGIFKEAALRLRDMENSLYPSEAMDALEIRTRPGDEIVVATPRGNIISGDVVAGRQVVLCSEPLYMRADLNATVLLEGSALIVIGSKPYLQSDVFDDVELSRAALTYDLQSGSVAEGGRRQTVARVGVGERVSVTVEREVIVREGSAQEMKLSLHLLKNRTVIHHAMIPYHSFVAILLDGTSTGQPAKLVVECPMYTCVRATHFPLGSALLYQTGVGNQWTVGRVLSTEGGLLEVGSEAFPSRRLPANSSQLLPLGHYADGITVLIDKAIVKSKGQLLSYLQDHSCEPAPLGLFPRLSKTPSCLPLLTRYEPFCCTTSADSPQVLSQAFLWSLARNNRMQATRCAFVLLPATISTEAILTPMRQRVQNWSQQAAHVLCCGQHWASARLQSRDLHLVDSPAIAASYEDVHQLHGAVLSDLIKAYHFLSDLQTVPVSWVQSQTAVRHEISHPEVTVGVAHLSDLYKHTFLLLERIQHRAPVRAKLQANSSYVSRHRDTAQLQDQGLAASSLDTQRDAAGRDDAADSAPHPPEPLLKRLHQAKHLKNNLCNTHSLVLGKSCCDDIVGGNVGDYALSLSYLSVTKVDLSGSLLDLLTPLTQLRGLSLSQCGVASLDGVATCCPSLATLMLADNRIASVPEELLALAGTLQHLDLIGNPVTELPDFVTAFRRLRTLKLSNTLIRRLPDAIGDLERLTRLELKGTLVNRLPSSFCRLRSLEVLNLQGIEWLSAAHVGSMLTFSAWMNWGEEILPMALIDDKEKEKMFHAYDANKTGSLEGEEIEQLQMALFRRFPRFGDAGDDEFGGIPEAVFGCVNLRSLFIERQALRSIPQCISRLRRLKSLSLSHNPLLHSIHGAIGKVPISLLLLRSCPSLRTPPPEIVSQGMNTVLAYLRRLSQGSLACHRTKLMFVGLGGAGKTSLMRALMSGDHMTTAVDGEGITDGIDISTWAVNNGKQKLTYSVWDFAGQTVYYNTHQFFLSSRAIYLLVWNTRLGYEHSGLNFWLNSIACHCPKAPVLIIGTHADQITKPHLPAESLHEKYPNISGFFIVSSTTGQGVEALMTDLLKVTLQQPYIGEMVPEAWLNFEQAILSKRSSGNLLRWKMITELANSSGIYGDEIKQAVQFLHELGTLQHFDNEMLRDRVIVNPQWIADVMSRVVSVHNTYIKEGRLLHKDLQHVWSSEPRDLHRWLLRLTETFDLTIALPDGAHNLVPCLLPQGEAEYSWPHAGDEPGAKEMTMIYKFDYLPVGLFNRAQVRLHEFSDSSTMWKTGSILKKNGHLGLMKQISDTELTVQVYGQRPENVLLMVHEVFETLIAQSFNGVKYEYQLPCRQCVEAGTMEPTMFSSRVLRRAVEMKALFLQCHTFFHILSISDVQNTMPPQSTSDYDLQLQTSIHDLQELEDDLGIDVFVLYSDENTHCPAGGSSVSPKRVISDLEKNGFKCWFADNLREKQTQDVALAVKNSKLVLVFISVEFVADEACQRMLHFAKDTLGKPLLLAVVGSGMGWLQSDVGMQVSEKLFINFQCAKQYDARMCELMNQLGTYRVSTQLRPADVFFSYCWLNSASAVKAGHARDLEGSVGHGDPRHIKDFLTQHQLQCWIDVERTGKVGLFEDIAEGMRQAKVVVACVSDEYVQSRNCQMEFRFAHVALKKPIILAVVGTGFQWESTEIGMLSLGYPKINFQVANGIAYDELLQQIQERCQREEVTTPVSNDQKQNAFQELYELAQRKFLRLICSYVETTDLYPRLFVPDYADTSKRVNVSRDTKDAETTDGEGTGGEGADVAGTGDGGACSGDDVGDTSDRSKSPPSHPFCIKLLCEYEGGWHCTADAGIAVDLAGTDLVSLWQLAGAYIARVLSILKHSSVDLQIVTSERGTALMKSLEKSTHAHNCSDMRAVYELLRRYVMSKDTGQLKGNLSRCRMSSGKTLWLCALHRDMTQATALNVASSSQPPLDDVERETGSAEMTLLSGLRRLREEGTEEPGTKKEISRRRQLLRSAASARTVVPSSGSSANRQRAVPSSAQRETVAQSTGRKSSRMCRIL